MNARYVVRARRWLLWMAALPLVQVAGCGAEFISSAIANETANWVAINLGTSVETALLNLFGV